MLDDIRQTLRAATLEKETPALERLISLVALSPEERSVIAEQGAELVRRVRGDANTGLMEEFLGEYGLSTEEGVALMCLAEALLRLSLIHI